MTTRFLLLGLLAVGSVAGAEAPVAIFSEADFPYYIASPDASPEFAAYCLREAGIEAQMVDANGLADADAFNSKVKLFWWGAGTAEEGIWNAAKKNLAELAAKYTPWYYQRTKAKPRFTPYSLEVLQSNSNISCKKAQTELGYKPRPIYESIADTVRWFLENRRAKSTA